MLTSIRSVQLLRCVVAIVKGTECQLSFNRASKLCTVDKPPKSAVVGTHGTHYCALNMTFWEWEYVYRNGDGGCRKSVCARRLDRDRLGINIWPCSENNGH